MGKIKVLLVDNQTLFVQSLRTLLHSLAKNIIVVGVASNGQAAIDLATSLHPDVILMDILMPGLSGMESIRIIKSKNPDIRILILTTCYDDEYVLRALHHGVAGYLIKNVQPAELVAAIHAVYEGQVVFAPEVANKLMKELFYATEKQPDINHDQCNLPDWLQFLTNREKEILVLMAHGNDNKRIAKQLYISEQTVKNYVSVIYSKLGMRDRMFISKMVREFGL